MDICAYCHQALSDIDTNCPRCSRPVEPPPNVRAARREAAALEQRYQQALAECQTRNVANQATDFAQQIEQHSHAVVNGDAGFFLSFFKDTKALYTNYQKMTQASIRIAAEEANDKRRMGTEGFLFGSYGCEIRYAALSLDGKGLHSYGNCSMRLWQGLAENCASLMEENSYKMVERAPMAYVQQINVPRGYRAEWQQRHKLALAKLANQVQVGTTAADYAGILLKCNGKREQDEFIEVHLFGAFSATAVDQASLPNKVVGKNEQFELEQLADVLAAKGVTCEHS